MSIRYIESTKQIVLETADTAYQMKIDELGYLQHLYYGKKLGQNNMSYPFRIYDHGFSGNPYEMRGNRAYSLDSMAQEYTSFGYELDLSQLSDEECDEIKEQIRKYKELEPIIHGGRMYRLSRKSDATHYMAWQFVSPDQSRALLNIVVTNPLANSAPVHVKLKGLIPDATYSVNGEFEVLGSALMKGGYTFPRLIGDYPAMQLDIVRV